MAKKLGSVFMVVAIVLGGFVAAYSSPAYGDTGNGNWPPIADPGGPYFTLPGVGLTLDASLSFDPDQGSGDHIVDYLWDLDNDGVFSDATGPNPTISDAQIVALGGNLVGRILFIGLKVTDTFGAVSSAANTAIYILDDVPPTSAFTASPNPALPGQTIAFDASSSHPGPGHSIISYSWNFGDGSTDSGVYVTHSYASAGSYNAVLTVTQDGGLLAMVSHRITINEEPSNSPPTADAGPDQTVEQTSPDGALVMLDGSGSVDDGQVAPLTYTWIWTGGSASGVQPEVLLSPGHTAISLTVYDGESSSSDSVSITVVDTTPPTIAAPADIAVEQNTPGGATISSLGTPTVSDAADPSPVVTNNAPSVFALGITDVVWTATDASGNMSTAIQKVTVTPSDPPSAIGIPFLSQTLMGVVATMCVLVLAIGLSRKARVSL